MIEVKNTTTAENSKPNNDLAVGDLLPLPNLSPGDYVFSTSKQSLDWLKGLMGFYVRGDFHTDGKGGLTLQFVSEDTLRCVRVYDHPEALKMLVMTQVTCEAGGVTLLLEGALLTPVGDEKGNDEYEVPETPSKPPSDPSRHLGGAVSASTDVYGMEVA